MRDRGGKRQLDKYGTMYLSATKKEWCSMTTKTHTEQHITYELVKEMADGLSEGCPFSYNQAR